MKFTKGTNLVIAERNKQLAKGRTIESDKEYNDRGQIPSVVKLLLINGLDKNQENFEEVICFLVETEKEYNPHLRWDTEILLDYMRKSYKERVKIAGALCIAELDRLL